MEEISSSFHSMKILTLVNHTSYRRFIIKTFYFKINHFPPEIFQKIMSLLNYVICSVHTTICAERLLVIKNIPIYSTGIFFFFFFRVTSLPSLRGLLARVCVCVLWNKCAREESRKVDRTRREKMIVGCRLLAMCKRRK